jgi:H+/Cl- antiporter ClcA
LTGILAGIFSSLFLILLELATRTRDLHPSIIWGLPAAGFLIGEVYFRYGNGSEKGTGLIIDEIHNPQKVLPGRMTPLVLLGTVLTHLFGGSAGREGTAVQMGASLGDQISKFFNVPAAERKILLVAGAGAGFGAAVGAPFAGVIFGMEVIRVGRLKIFAPLECFVASFAAFYTARWLRAPHSHYPPIAIPDLEIRTLGFIVAAGILFGLTARLFVGITHGVEWLQSKFVKYPPARPLLAGILLCLLFTLPHMYQYAGLGIPTIQRALTSPFGFAVPALKTIFTALTVGSGFKGGEFIPMVFIGTTLGSALSSIIPVSSGLLAAVGFAAVFGAGANTPIACTIMAMEIFGPKIGAYALLGCLAAYTASGPRGIYRGQREAPFIFKFSFRRWDRMFGNGAKRFGR